MSDSFYGLYSTTGFDLLSILSKVSSRKNPTIELGPIDLSCSFVVSDAQREDMPIVYVSSTFEVLTGYESCEILGKNCRFLQAPGGVVTKGERRQFADSQVVYEMKRNIETAKECQYLNINYKKSGEPFVNLITVIPVFLDETSGIVTHYVGFQCDLLEQSNSILNRVSDNEYVVNYNNQTLDNLPDFIIQTYGHKAVSHPQSQVTLEGAALTSHPSQRFQRKVSLETSQRKVSLETSDIELVPLEEDITFAEKDIKESPDCIHILSSRGLLLYMSDTFRKDVLQYDSKDLVGSSLSDFCHPGDFGPLMKLLKTVDFGEKISTMYRFKSKYFGYIWLDVTGQKYELPNSKKIKCFVLSGRVRQLHALPHRMLVDDVVSLDGMSDLWLKISYYGLILFVSSVCQMEPFGTANAKLFGTSVYDYITPKSIIDLKKALSEATVDCPIPLSVTSKKGDQLTVKAHPCVSFIFLRIIAQNVDTNSPTITPDIIYPSTALYVDTFLPISENSHLGYQFEIKKLHAFNQKLKEEIQNVLNHKKRKF